MRLICIPEGMCTCAVVFSSETRNCDDQSLFDLAADSGILLVEQGPCEAILMIVLGIKILEISITAERWGSTRKTIKTALDPNATSECIDKHVHCESLALRMNQWMFFGGIHLLGKPVTPLMHSKASQNASPQDIYVCKFPYLSDNISQDI